MFFSPTKCFHCPLVSLLLFCLLFYFSFPGNSLLDAASSHPSPPSTSPSASAGFWIAVELISVEFRKGCISTALCHQPAFKLTQLMTLNGQSALMSWPVEGSGPKTLIQKDTPRQFIAHWPLGDPEDVSIGCQIAGTDPSFGFARTCDETPSRRLFQEQMVRRILPKGIRQNGDNNDQSAEGDERGDSLLVQMNGRCFNATLAIQKHISRCPWCPDPNVDIQVVGGTAGTGQMNEQLSPKDDALKLQNALILALSGAVVFSLTGLCCALGAHWRYRKGSNQMGGRSSHKGTAPLMLNAGKQAKKKRILKLVSPPRAQRSLPSPMDEQQQRSHLHERGTETAILYGQHGGGTEEQSRYDVPWDNKFCLVPRQWLLNQQQSLDSCASMAFSGGIEPLPMMGGRNGTVEYATCAEFCAASAINSPPPTLPNSMTARLPPPPPPPFPPFRHSQQGTTQLPPPILSRQSQQQQMKAGSATFSPNTSGNSGSSSFGRHDDSGLDSV